MMMYIVGSQVKTAGLNGLGLNRPDMMAEYQE